MDVVAVVVARGRSAVDGSRVGRAAAYEELDPLTPVGGVPMVTRAVRAVLAGLPDGTGRFVHVITTAARTAAVERACAGLPVQVRESFPVRAHVVERADPGPGDARPPTSSGPVATPPVAEPPVPVLLHDAARPLTPPSLVRAVLAAALADPDCVAVLPVLPLTDTVKLVDADRLLTATPDRSGLRVAQTPQLLRTRPVDLDADPGAATPAGLPSVGPLVGSGSGRVRTVPGDPLAFPVRTAWDLQLAELLLDRGEAR